MDPATVKIQSDDTDFGYVIINKEDFDENEHTLFVETAPRDPGASASESGTDGEGDDSGDEAPDQAKLMKMNKDVLVTMAKEKGHEFVPDEKTKAQLVELILGS